MAPSGATLKCICGSRFTEDRYLTRHQSQCKRAQEASRRVWKRIERVDREENTTSKRRRLDGREHGSEDTQSFFMRRLQKKQGKKANSSEANIRNDLEAQSVPSGSGSGDSSLPQGSVEPDVPTETSPSSEYLEMRQETPLPRKRVVKLTERMKAFLADCLPEGPGPLDDSTPAPAPPPSESSPPNTPPPATILLRIRRAIKTLKNSFGTSRTYYGRPSGIPDTDQSLRELITEDLQPKVTKSRRISDIIFPYPNVNAYRFNHWFWNGGNAKSKASRQSLLSDVLLRDDFDAEELRGVNFDTIDDMLAQDIGGSLDGNGWKTTNITIKIPTGQKTTKASKRRDAAAAAARHDYDTASESGSDEDEVPTRKFVVPGFHYRKLTHIVKETCGSEAAKTFHWHPFEEHWQPPWDGAIPERVHGDLFSSKAFLDADRELQNSTPEPGCDLPRVIAGMMYWSDATHVAQFGQAKLWPFYNYFGNQTKYDRCKPSARAAHHFAYLPSLPDDIQDFLRKTGRAGSAALLAHCRRELFHGAWAILLDDEFLEAYKHGIVIDCGDGVRRRVYPRIFTYSADYPEKVLIATIRDMGQCPCPRCLVNKTAIREMGTSADMAARVQQARKDDEDLREKVTHARKLIYEHGYVVNSDRVEEYLKSESLVPTKNAFSSFSSRLGGSPILDFFLLLVVDLMHEFELGVWKALLIHLIRILHSVGPEAVHVFNERFRQVPPFGRSTIRKFPYNVADLKKLAARDFEDILQCCIPCFEGLLPEPHNETLLDLLYILSYWHSLAKLRMHTDSSLTVLRLVTGVLGDGLRFFADETCRHFQTIETDGEYQARSRAAARRFAQSGSTSQPSVSGKRKRTFNLETSKLHALGDYVSHIELFGTTDSYTTQLGEHQHRVLKGYNARTSHNNAVPQIVGIDVRQAAHARISSELALLEFDDSDTVANSPPGEDSLVDRYRISQDEHNFYHLEEWLDKHRLDPAFKDFLPRLKAHLLARHRGITFTGEEPQFEASELDQVIFQHHRIYPHATAGFNYTTYDIRREQDTINYNTPRCDVMLPSYEDSSADNPSHPYWYARVIGIFHAKIFFPDSRSPKIMKFLWVRWFGRDPQWLSGPKALRLDRVGFVPEEDPEAFGFLDPAQVIRACHLIPAFAYGKTLSLLRPSAVRDSEDGDWMNYYVMRFVDRDMMMRYLGLGIGHNQAPDFPREDDMLRPIPCGQSYVYTDWDCAESEESKEEEEGEGEEEEEEAIEEIGYEY